MTPMRGKSLPGRYYGMTAHICYHNRYETIGDLMTLQDQIESFQKLIFAHFRGSNNNECRISALVPLVKESYGIYRFITSMMRAMYRSTYDSSKIDFAVHD